MVTIYVHPANLVASETRLLQRAFNFRIMPDGGFLLSVPAPEGYIYWTNDAADFEDSAKVFLSTHQVKEIEK